MTFKDRIIARFSRRAPDFVIGGHERPYLLRWFVIPRNPVFNIYLHEFRRSDDDRALHDHPWLFNASWLLCGGYIEHTIKAGGILVQTLRQAGNWKLRFGPAPHRVELLTTAHYVKTQPGSTTTMRCWTLFITGPRVRQWGFHCPDRGWIHWKQFTAVKDLGGGGTEVRNREVRKCSRRRGYINITGAGMIASTYITILQELIDQHGDLEVEKWMPAKGRHEAPTPVLAFIRKFVTPRDHSLGGIGSFYHTTDNPNQKGGPVIRI